MEATCKTSTERLQEYTKHTYDNRNKHLQSAAHITLHHMIKMRYMYIQIR